MRRSVSVTIPAGTNPGSVMIFKGEGRQYHPSLPPSDLEVEIHVEDDKTYWREGSQLQNICSYLQIDMLEAIFGCEREVDTIWGRSKVRVPKGTLHG